MFIFTFFFLLKSESLKTVEQNVVNTWFVESPVKSEEVYSKIGGPLNDSLDCGSGINSAQERLASYYNFAAQLIRDAGGILVVAGAGIGVDSGLPGKFGSFSHMFSFLIVI